MLTTLAALKSELGITGTDDDAALTDIIEQWSAEAEGYCNRTFAAATQSQTFRLDRCRPRLVLGRVPVTAVDSVTVDGTALTVADDVAIEDADAGTLLRVDADGNSIGWSDRLIVVSYTAGYASTPPAVERCVLDLCVRAWRARGRDPSLRSETFEGIGATSWTAVASQEMRGGLPVDVAERLDRYRLVSFG